MDTNHHGDDAWIERVASTLREPPASHGAAETRIMDRVRQEAAGGAGPTAAGPAAWWRWLVRPRPIVLPPLVPLATAGLIMLLAGLLVQSTHRPGPGGASGGPGHEGEKERALVTPASSRPVQFVCLAVDASRVSVVGDFNDWDPGQAPLQRAGNRGVWSGLLWLPPGVYKYALVVDGRPQAADDARPASPPDEFGVASSVLIVERETI